MSTYSDLLITGDDLTLDADGLPLMVTDRDCIAQDILHAIRESGYLPPLVAERSSERRRLWLQRIVLLVEADRRIIPGSVDIEPAGEPGVWNLLADTYEFGRLTINASVS
ncbi:MAG: hypothetical protein RL095_2179 [Verrucomicrobiota bacterium]|jgi:hypothetical protein